MNRSFIKWSGSKASNGVVEKLKREKWGTNYRSEWATEKEQLPEPNFIALWLQEKVTVKTARLDFPGGPEAKILHSECRGPGHRTRTHARQLKILHASMKTEDPVCCN